ncbi:hypothetical protein PG993_000992 [Apiospora rasikravindrae]|uniref:AA1-like domain-containing protein n=1 Tax=Apiospora rasikravindrae TaxID=990691 RepID=A0ABR1UA60_9PEZI
MKVLTAMTAVLSSISFSAAAPHPRANIPSELAIAGFTASTESVRPAAYFTFNVSGGDATTTCSFSGNSADGGLLPDVAWRNCEDAAFQWQFRHEPSRPGTSGPYLLVVTYQIDAQTGQRVGGFKEWQASTFPIEESTDGTTQAYKGDADFSIINLS